MTPSKQSAAGTTREFLTGAERSGRDESKESEARELAIALARTCGDDKCTDVLVLDVRGLSPITGYIVIASGTSDRQMRSVLDHCVDEAEERGSGPFRVTKDAGVKWLIADFVDVVVHLFEPATRAHYDLEMLWGDAGKIDWKRPGPASGGD